MRTGTYRTSSYRTRGDTGRRLVSTALALAIAVAIILALLGMGGARLDDFGDGRRLTTFDVTRDGAAAKSKATQRDTRQKQVAQPEKAPVTPPRPDVPTPAPPLPPPPIQLPGVMVLDRKTYAAADIGAIRGTPGPAAAAGGDAGNGDDTETVGIGPGGEPLYAAEWYRKPTRAETSPYMPAGKTGWGMVACRTAPRFHVEDCRQLGESPGSGIGRGLRQAAWQFLVRPPRKGGNPIIGAWVRIRFDITEGPGPADDDGR